MENKNLMLIESIIQTIGGVDNIKNIYNCATRMRLTFKNNKLVKIEDFKKIKEIYGAIWSNNELQIIIGSNASQLTSLLKEKLNNSNNNRLKFKVKNITSIISGIFGPLIPFLIGVGLLMALHNILIKTGLINNIKENMHYGLDYNAFDLILYVLANNGFKLMGVLALWSTAKYFGGDIVIALCLGLIMISPLIPEKGIEIIKIWNYQIMIKPFYSNILIFVIIGIFISFISKIIQKYTFPTINFLLNPILALLLGSLLAFFVFGPIVGFLEIIMLKVFNFFMTLPFGLGGLIVGLTWQPLVVLGVHNVLFFTAISDMVVNNRSSLFLAAAFAAAWAQMGATIGVGLKEKTKIAKSSAFSAAIPGIISGPTESCIYAINLPRKLPFILGTLIGGLGGFMIAIFNVKLDNLAGLGGIIGFLAYDQSFWYAISINLLTFLLSILVIYFFWKPKNTK